MFSRVLVFAFYSHITHWSACSIAFTHCLIETRFSKIHVGQCSSALRALYLRYVSADRYINNLKGPGSYRILLAPPCSAYMCFLVPFSFPLDWKELLVVGSVTT